MVPWLAGYPSFNAAHPQLIDRRIKLTIQTVLAGYYNYCGRELGT
jgi:hypothetical protein